MADLTMQAAWALLIAFLLSIAYEAYRATARAGASRHDSIPTFIRTLPLYVVATIVIALLFAGFPWSSWIGLVFSLGMILVSIGYYNPTIMPERSPGLLDWVEDLVYTGLLFVAAALLLYQVLGITLRP